MTEERGDFTFSGFDSNSKRREDPPKRWTRATYGGKSLKMGNTETPYPYKTFASTDRECYGPATAYSDLDGQRRQEIIGETTYPLPHRTSVRPWSKKFKPATAYSDLDQKRRQEILDEI